MRINGEERKLIKFVEENGWSILNGCTRGNEEGEYSFTGGKGNTVIDNAIGDLEVRERIQTLEEVESKRYEGNRRKVGWWDGDCKEAKRKVRMKLREWRKKGEEEYRGRKKEYREICKKKKREWKEEWERKVKEVKREHEVWEIVNRERKGRKRVNEDIEMGEKEYLDGRNIL